MAHLVLGNFGPNTSRVETRDAYAFKFISSHTFFGGNVVTVLAMKKIRRLGYQTVNVRPYMMTHRALLSN